MPSRFEGLSKRIALGSTALAVLLHVVVDPAVGVGVLAIGAPILWFAALRGQRPERPTEYAGLVFGSSLLIAAVMYLMPTAPSIVVLPIVLACAYRARLW